MGTKSMRIGLPTFMAAAIAVAAIHGPVEAQEAGLRAGWQPYLGCWQSMAAAEEADEDQGILCLVASGRDVEMLTIVGGEIEFREPLLADGGTHEFEQDDCQGTESARFSEDRRRLYTASMVTCDGEAPRRSTGIISMPTLGEWIDVRAMETNGAFTVWSQRYQRTSHSVLNQLGLDAPARTNPFALRGGITYATADVTIDDVIDASRNVDVDAVKGWLAEVGQEFEGLGAEDLIRMEDAGVATALIDMVVAVSFPEHFALNQDATRDDRSRMYMYPWNPFGYGYGYFGYGYGGYGYRYRYGWGPGYYNPVVVTVGRIPRGGGGQAVAGRGYRRPGPTTNPDYTIGSSSSGRSSGGKASTGRTSTGRTAVRRGGK